MDIGSKPNGDNNSKNFINYSNHPAASDRIINIENEMREELNVNRNENIELLSIALRIVFTNKWFKILLILTFGLLLLNIYCKLKYLKMIN